VSGSKTAWQSGALVLVFVLAGSIRPIAVPAAAPSDWNLSPSQIALPLPLPLPSPSCRDAACYEPIQQRLGALGCESFVLYEHVNTMGGVCFAKAADASDARKQLVNTYFNIRQTGGVVTAALDARVQLNPLFPNMQWVKGQWGGGWWRSRRPRAPKTAPAPATSPPAPSPPVSDSNGPGPAPAPAPSGPRPVQDSNVYNWGNDRINQVRGWWCGVVWCGVGLGLLFPPPSFSSPPQHVVGSPLMPHLQPPFLLCCAHLRHQNQIPSNLDKNRAQCASKGTGVVIFVLDTGCRTTHQVHTYMHACMHAYIHAYDLLCIDCHRLCSPGPLHSTHATRLDSH
jgi:hypothetical protein